MGKEGRGTRVGSDACSLFDTALIVLDHARCLHDDAARAATSVRPRLRLRRWLVHLLLVLPMLNRRVVRDAGADGSDMVAMRGNSCCTQPHRAVINMWIYEQCVKTG